MGKFRVEVTDFAKEHFKKHYKSGNKKTIKKLEKILSEFEDDPYIGTGNPEPLKHQLSGFWSQQINKKDRRIYKVEEDIVTVYVIAAMGHYSNK